MSGGVCLWSTLKVTLVILLLAQELDLSLTRSYEDYLKSPQYESDALRTLQRIQKRLQSGRHASGDHGVSKRGRWRRKSCRSWREPCTAWTSTRSEQCCDQSSQICRCNLWMQNCRCASRTWG
ncbi:hypothetical protein EGW08_003572 [Elysia chlorotica]|uniref:Cocaine- and amphetamine-regulated transcript protein n=1 Tax=Elysia chlorotica TaxID=188477 RepID=A0A3S1BPX7_ELYCH|nr:hypothetical protein EGW08_003572 [Elysia chlorotica]